MLDTFFERGQPLRKIYTEGGWINQSIKYSDSKSTVLLNSMRFILEN